MNIEKIREEFEAWAKFDPNGCGRPSLSNEPGREGEYEDSHTNLCWRAWQASRAAIEVELPDIKAFEGAYDSCKHNEFAPQMADIEDADEIFGLIRSVEVREAIESLGLKVKS